MSAKLQELFKKLFDETSFHENLFNEMMLVMQRDIEVCDLLTLGLIDQVLLDELKKYTISNENEAVFFGKSLRDIKCVVQDEATNREHEIFVKYEGPKKLIISSVNLPYTPLQDREYKTLDEIFTSYKSYINGLSPYFYELERIDHVCTVMEPKNPSFKDNYRRILLDDRIWLHVEVTPQGLATNIHLVSHSDLWHNKLQLGILSWDHDKDIVDNVMSVFDLSEFPVISNSAPDCDHNIDFMKEDFVCGICLCNELPGNIGVPQPLCQNPTCGVYFHRNCLYEWLVACSGNRPPAFGVATGTCPTCLQSVACSKNY